MAQTNTPYDRDADQQPRHDRLPAEDRPSATGKSSDPRGEYNPQTSPKGDRSDPRGDSSQDSKSDLGKKESQSDAGSGPGKDSHQSSSKLDAAEKAGGGLGGGGLYSPGDMGGGGAAKKVLAFLGKRKKSSGVAGLVIGAVVAFATFTSGPLQFVHFAQLLQKFHMSSNEDFGDDRTSKVLLYALAGFGAERGRLGVTGNHAADKWEKRMLRETGLRPVYSADTRRFVGFEIVDEDKFTNKVLSADAKNSKAIERTMGKGAEIRTASEASAGKQNIVRGGKGGKLSGKARIVDLRSVKSYAERRKFVRTVGRLTSTSKISSTVASRLLIKRGGINFHPFKNIPRKSGESLADYRERRRAVAAEEDRTGTISKNTAHDPSKDSQGNPTETAPDANATDGTNAAIEEAKAKPGADSIKKIIKSLGKGALAVGILCAARGFGNDVTNYKYQNNALPMMRMGMRTITMGNQVMSGQDVNLDELGAMDAAFYDKEAKTSWADSKSVQAELGEKQTGPDMPPEARLNNVNDKPVFFDILDKVPLLKTACDISGLISSLPIIKQVTSITSKAVIEALNIPAGLFGTSVDAIMESALAAASGQSVNTLASGAEYGNLANTGAFLAANDNAVSMGGAPLSTSDTLALKAESNAGDVQDNATKSIAERYLNPYDYHSIVASLIDRAPSSAPQMALMATSAGTLFSGGLTHVFSNFMPKAHAASPPYDYGVPKYGFSPADRDNPKFEDPYENAAIIEQGTTLNDLNEKYGKVCFGMTITAGDDGVHVDSESMGSDDLNIFKVREEHSKECDPKINKDPMLLRYRFYLADAVTAVSMNCYEGGTGSEQSCAEIGFGGGSAANAATTPASANATPAITGSAAELAQKLLDSKTVTLQANPASSLKAAAAGDKSPAGIDHCGVQHPPVAINAKLLGFLVDLSAVDSFTITSLTTGEHACTSNHYKGEAVDLGCDVDLAKADAIGKKYGISHNFESCADASPHFHYSIGGG